MTYRMNQVATDILVFVEASDDLTAGSWFPVALETERVDMGTYWLVTARDAVPITSAPHRFMRLHVQKP
jgi:hypothetical protein